VLSEQSRALVENWELPAGANLIRAQLMWQVALQLASDPAIPHGGDRDYQVAVGAGAGSEFRPRLRMATGSPLLARAVAQGTLDMAMVNPSALLTQAVRGVGAFQEPLPMRIVAVYPSWDRFVCLRHPDSKFESLAQVCRDKLPLRISIREDPAHSTRFLLDQIFAAHGFSIDDLLSWGGSLQTNGSPGDQRRLAAIREGSVDAIFDEGLTWPVWFETAIENGYRPLELESGATDRITQLGWKLTVVPKADFAVLTEDMPAIDFSGWPLYARADTPEELVYDVCAALAARSAHIPWESSFTGISELWDGGEAAPLSAPLHAGAERWRQSHS
jgi:TRAP-type uncharacterized transport system substrate-binding protein